MKSRHATRSWVSLGCPRQRRRELAQQQARAGDVALVHLVAHRQPARDQRLQGNAAHFAQRPSERRPQDLADPAQPVEHLGIVAAEPHDLAEPLIDRAIGAVAEGLVLDHQERLASRSSCRSSDRPRHNHGWDGTRMSRPRLLVAASPRSLAHPSKTAMPMTAPRMGPHIRSHPIGGPACRIMRSASSAMACDAGTTSTRIGSPAMMRRSAS